jgi:hypothetical protein
MGGSGYDGFGLCPNQWPYPAGLAMVEFDHRDALGFTHD